MLRPVVIALLSLGLFACAKSNINGRGFGGSDQLTSELDTIRQRALAAVARYRQEGDPHGYLCATRYAGDASPFTVATLRYLNASPTKLAYVRAFLSSDANLSDLQAALARARVRITSDESELTLDGDVQDALTVGDEMRFNRTRLETKREFDRMTLAFHESLHVKNPLFRDKQPDGPFDLTSTELDSIASCFTAFGRGTDGLPAWDPPETGGGTVEQPPTAGNGFRFYDDFSVNHPNGGLELAWRTLYGNPATSGGFLNPLDGGAFESVVSWVNESDVHIVASLDLAVQVAGSHPWVNVIGRATDNGGALSFAMATTLEDPQVLTLGLFRRAPGETNPNNWVGVDGVNFRDTNGDFLKGELDVTMVGTHYRVRWRGVTRYEKDLPGLSFQPGHVGLRASGVKFDYFSADKP